MLALLCWLHFVHAAAAAVPCFLLAGITVIFSPVSPWVTLAHSFHSLFSPFIFSFSLLTTICLHTSVGYYIRRERRKKILRNLVPRSVCLSLSLLKWQTSRSVLKLPDHISFCCSFSHRLDPSNWYSPATLHPVKNIVILLLTSSIHPYSSLIIIQPTDPTNSSQ